MSICASCTHRPCTCPVLKHSDDCFYDTDDDGYVIDQIVCVDGCPFGTRPTGCHFCNTVINHHEIACPSCSGEWWFLWSNNFAAACTVACQNGDDELARRRLYNELKAIGMV